jgi:peptidoglycan/xylan/chitin deacetylase (PgdA/CDA1 family)
MAMGKTTNREFASVKPLRAEFSYGVPVMVYHKLGPMPSGVQMKSLYVGERLFAWQVRDLKRNGFSSASPDAWREFSPPPPGRVVLTFDDGSETVLRHAVPVLASEHFTGIQFIVTGLIGGFNAWDVRDLGEVPDRLMDESGIREWLAAGHQIGAHTHTHPRLTKIPLSEAREEISGSKKRLEDMFGIPIRHFCYPYGNWNRSVRDLVWEAGYETAVTLDFGVNDALGDPLALKRIGARHPPRNVRSFLTLAAAGFPIRFFFGSR